VERWKGGWSDHALPGFTDTVVSGSRNHIPYTAFSSHHLLADQITTSMELIDTPRYEDYEIKYHSINRWAFLGNGWSVRDYNGRDITWFWGLVDNEDKKQEYVLEWAPGDNTAQGSDPSDEKKATDTLILPNGV